MLPSRIYSRPRIVLFALAALLYVYSPSALAAGPAKVTVRVEGVSETIVAPVTVTTNTNPVVKDGNQEHSCAGTSAAGALEQATAGHWGGSWFSGLGYSVETIEQTSYPFTQPYFWNFWLNNKSQEVGVCGVELESGDQVLLFPCYYEENKACPTPLGIEAPATANAGEAVTVTVGQYNSKGEASPAVGANVAGGGVSASTDFQGHATMRFSGDGTYTLHANGSSEGPPAVRSETSICVHEGNDGTCGTSIAGGSSPTQTASATATSHPYTGVFALVARSTAVRDGHVYSRRQAPRLLTGTVIAHSPVTSISISLRRRSKGRCFTYNGTLERFVKAPCGKDGFFKVASGGTSFSYLLPAKLAPGRYVFDISSTDTAGNHAALARGSTRTVFYVR